MTAPDNHLEGISRSGFLPLPQIRHSEDPRHPQDLVSLSQRGFSAEIQHQSCLGLQAHLKRPNTSLAFVPTPAPVPGKELSDSPVLSG